MKKQIIFAVLVTLSTIVLHAQKNQKITIEITGMESDNGQVYVALYDSEANFLKKAYKGKVSKIDKKTAVVVFDSIPNGTYAISAFHDENNNNKLDTRIFGIPKEPTGCSNGAVGRFGPPKFKDAKFILDKQNLAISITVK